MKGMSDPQPLCSVCSRAARGENALYAGPMKNSLVVWGPDSSLSTELGRRIAERAGRPLLGIDEPNKTATQSVSILAADALIDRGKRLAALDQATLVSVVGGSGASLSPEEALKRSVYSESHLCLKAERVDELESLVGAAVGTWNRRPIAVAAGERSYCVDVAVDWPASAIKERASAASSILFVTDQNVRPLHASPVIDLLEASGRPVTVVVVPPGEEYKNLASVESIWKQALEGGIDRKSLVVALGGGVVTDMAGFAAAGWMRGVAWVGLPTTLLAMVDASVGGKTAVDLGRAKNAIGAFWQPSAVFCATKVLATESTRGYSSALAEVVKTAIIGDPELFGMLEDRVEPVAARDSELVGDIVRRCIRVKSRIVSLDEREGGVRASLNLGHTIGHALEAEGGYSNLSHGEAVSLGLVAALRLGERLGATPSALTDRTILLLSRLGLPTTLDPAALRRSAELLGFDKKRAGQGLSFVVAHQLGNVQTRRLTLEELTGLTLALAEALGG